MSDAVSNADKAFPGVPFEFGNPPEKHVLLYDLYSFCMLDEKTGKNPLNGEVWQDIRPKDLAVLIWAGLLHENNALTVEDIAKKISMADLSRLTSAIQSAFAQANPVTTEEKKTSPQGDTMGG